jgi:hypothetical protein
MLPVGLDILGRPKGENRIAHGLQSWEDGPERNRPERATEGRSLFPKIRFVESDSTRKTECGRDRPLRRF